MISDCHAGSCDIGLGALFAVNLGGGRRAEPDCRLPALIARKSAGQPEKGEKAGQYHPYEFIDIVDDRHLEHAVVFQGLGSDTASSGVNGQIRHNYRQAR